MRFILSLACCAALCACSSDEPAHPLPNAYYDCQNGNSLFVIFEPNAARVKMKTGETVVLPQQRAASGMWYRSDRYALRGKGDDATWTAAQAAPTQCHVN
jgi:membrane-bound inhibitor of C-type lysozyme